MTQTDFSLEAHAARERVEKRISVLGERVWVDGEVVCSGAALSPTSYLLYHREEAAPETSISSHGLVEG